MTTCLSRYSAELMANHVIQSLNGGDLIVYAGGSAHPRHPEHTLARCVIELARYRLANPSGFFDDSDGYSRITFNPVARLTNQQNYEVYPNFHRLYNTQGVCLYQGPARVVTNRFQDGGSTADDTLTGMLSLTPVDRARDHRFRSGNNSTYEWQNLPRWVDIKFNYLGIMFGGAK